MTYAILGIGTALPPNSVEQSKAAEYARSLICESEDQAALLPVLYRQTGVRRRYMVYNQHVLEEVVTTGTTSVSSVFIPRDRNDRGPTTLQRMERYMQEAPTLACQAASEALERAEVLPREITHLITVSCTGFSAPGFDIALIKRLGLPATTQRVHVGFMGCHGALNGLRVARGIAAAEPDSRILLCAVELCSLHFHYGWDPKKVVANALFADGAAAVVGAPVPEGQSQPWRMAASGSCLIPDSEYAMTWNIGNHGFEMTLSTRVPTLIGENLRPFLDSWLGRQGLRVEDIRSWAVHPGGPRILSCVEEPLGLTPEQTNVSREVLADHGNMSSPTVLFILQRLREREAPLPCVALGFGPGLVAEAALFV
ncbi:MAG: type III polyketide synthase [Gemmatales bacterium]|nr:type III polyketide synthase [Gemmatales bacterium]MDW8387149.1 type III polyketide synthase [Gemmatales bacterium]